MQSVRMGITCCQRRTYLPGRVRAAGAAACCAVVLAHDLAIFPEERTIVIHRRLRAAWNLARRCPTIHDRSHGITSPSPSSRRRKPKSCRRRARTAASHAMGFWEDANAVRQLTGQAANAASSEKSGTGTDPDVAAPRLEATTPSACRPRTSPTSPLCRTASMFITRSKRARFSLYAGAADQQFLAWPVRCTADQDVWSMDGTTILLPRGTQVNGSVEHGLATGEERLFLVWTDALTRGQTCSPFHSTARGGRTGQTGAPGDVDDHLWKRIKTALLLSALSSSQRRHSRSRTGSQQHVSEFQRRCEHRQLAGTDGVRRDLNIPPTLYRGPGQPLAVYVNHYIDLYRFYQDG